MWALTREAINEKLSRVQQTRAKAIDKLLAAEPMPVENWPVMKQQMLDGRYGSVIELSDGD